MWELQSGVWSPWSVLSHCPVSRCIAVFMALHPVSKSSLNLGGISALDLLMANRQNKAIGSEGIRTYSKLSVSDCLTSTGFPKYYVPVWEWSQEV